MAAALEQESAEARMARQEAPIKYEFVRPAHAREPFPRLAAADGAPPTNGPTIDSSRSKNQMKRDRAIARQSDGTLCSAYLQGKCKFGDACKFNHDIAKYLAEKPADLPGSCPFYHTAEPCRHGLMCRWASTHKHHTELEKQQLEAIAAAAAAKPPLTTGGAIAPTAAGENGADKPMKDAWWKNDGSVPEGVLPVEPAASVLPFINNLSKDRVVKLRKGEYDFSKADAVLQSLGVRNTAKARDKGGARRKNAAAAALGEGDAGEAVSAAKRQKLESGAAAQGSTDAEFLQRTLGGAGGGGGGAAAVASGAAAEAARERRTIDFRGKTFLAPLTTVGNLPFRRLCKGLGADVTCGEMALATNLLQGQASEWALLKRHPEEDCFGVQVCGGFGDAMGRCAQLIEENAEVDFVDINFGCPIDVVINKGAGSACLLRPQRMQDIVRSMTSILSCPLTLKMRKGYDDGKDVAHELVPKVGAWGATAVTLHGRSREQRYSRMADWGYIKKCSSAASAAGVQLIGNGDVMSWQDHEKAVADPGIATTYVARGALIKPWVFTEIREKRDWDISAAERLDLVRKFVRHGLEHWGSDAWGVQTTRRFILEWLSFANRYVPVGLLEALPQATNWRPAAFVGRSDLETLLASPDPLDWIRISELAGLGPAPAGFVFRPKHKATSYVAPKKAAKEGGVEAVAEEQENG